MYIICIMLYMKKYMFEKNHCQNINNANKKPDVCCLAYRVYKSQSRELESVNTKVDVLNI